MTPPIRAAARSRTPEPEDDEPRATVRVLRAGDLAAILRIDREATGQKREEFFRVKIERAVREPKLQTSLVAEVDGNVVGFVFATLYFGEYGRLEPVAVLDAIGVDPAFRRSRVGSEMMKQLEMGLRALHVERLETIVGWRELELLGFLAKRGFSPGPRLCLELAL